MSKCGLEVSLVWWIVDEAEDGNIIRRRGNEECHYRFTYQRVEERTLVVVKKWDTRAIS